MPLRVVVVDAEQAGAAGFQLGAWAWAVEQEQCSCVNTAELGVGVGHGSRRKSFCRGDPVGEVDQRRDVLLAKPRVFGGDDDGVSVCLSHKVAFRLNS